MTILLLIKQLYKIQTKIEMRYIFNIDLMWSLIIQSEKISDM